MVKQTGWLVAIWILVSGVGTGVTAATGALHGNYVHHCLITPKDSTPSYPGRKHIHPSSDLAQPTGKAEPAPGELIRLSGTIVDRNCVPLQDARIEIWHTDRDGKYRRPDRGAFASAEPLFAGSGTAITDNLGRYVFSSIYPGAYEFSYGQQRRVRAPHVNMRISHPALSASYHVEMYFAGDARNDKDPYFIRIPDDRKARAEATVTPGTSGDINQGLNVYFNITVPAVDPFRHH